MEIVSDSEGKEDITEESTETDRVAKGYDLPVSDSERKEAEDDCKEKMELIAELYKNADKGYASNVIIADEIIDQMVEKLKSIGCLVTVTALYSDMENYKELEDFLNSSVISSLPSLSDTISILSLPLLQAQNETQHSSIMTSRISLF
mgnify:CR=1 FL=1